ncbi:MAG: FISUMP domain-containing protein, partial [Bacteroidota bacterium]
LAVPSFSCGQSLTDIRDNTVYPTIQLGSQCWMQKNLNYGNSIQGAIEQTDNCINEKYCYNDNAANCSLYGGLYLWDEMMAYTNTPGAQGLCPPGWHIPTQSEWNTLFTLYQNQALAGKPLQDSIFNGFRAKESGIVYSNISWKFEGFATVYWTSNPYGVIKALSHGMNMQNFSVSDYYSNRSNAFAVRCLRD